jgi:putative tryptophan/tyrosine transport system substrate-binding protein
MAQFLEPKCDILFIPDVVLGGGEAMRRREFIAFFGGAAATLPLAARAQQSEPMRRIGVLMNVTADQPLGQSGLAVFQQGLQQLGWNDGRQAATLLRRVTRWT